MMMMRRRPEGKECNEISGVLLESMKKEEEAEQEGDEEEQEEWYEEEEEAGGKGMRENMQILEGIY